MGFELDKIVNYFSPLVACIAPSSIRKASQYGGKTIAKLNYIYQIVVVEEERRRDIKPPHLSVQFLCLCQDS